MKNSTLNLSYSQPEFYKFNEDSIFLVNFVYNKIKSDLQNSNVLDLCSGCGVLGFELILRSKFKFSLDLIELQSEYLKHIQYNKNSFFNTEKIKIYISSYQKLGVEFNSRYDFILSNPPYFIKNTKRLSDNCNRNLSRHWLCGDYKSFIQRMYKLLRPRGKAFFITTEDISIFDQKKCCCLISQKGQLKLYLLVRLNKDVN